MFGGVFKAQVDASWKKTTPSPLCASKQHQIWTWFKLLPRNAPETWGWQGASALASSEQSSRTALGRWHSPGSGWDLCLEQWRRQKWRRAAQQSWGSRHGDGFGRGKETTGLGWSTRNPSREWGKGNAGRDRAFLKDETREASVDL